MPRRILLILAAVAGLLAQCESPCESIIPSLTTAIEIADPPEVPRASLEAVRIYRPIPRPPVFEIILGDRTHKLDWSQLVRMSAQAGNTEVDLVVRAQLDEIPLGETPPQVCLADVSVVRGADRAGMAITRYVENVVKTWCFTPYRSGVLYYRINLYGRRFTVSYADLVAPPGSEDIGVGDWTFRVTNRRQYQVRFSRGSIR